MFCRKRFDWKLILSLLILFLALFVLFFVSPPVFGQGADETDQIVFWIYGGNQPVFVQDIIGVVFSSRNLPVCVYLKAKSGNIYFPAESIQPGPGFEVLKAMGLVPAGFAVETWPEPFDFSTEWDLVHFLDGESRFVEYSRLEEYALPSPSLSLVSEECIRSTWSYDLSLGQMYSLWGFSPRFFWYPVVFEEMESFSNGLPCEVHEVPSCYQVVCLQRVVGFTAYTPLFKIVVSLGGEKIIPPHDFSLGVRYYTGPWGMPILSLLTFDGGEHWVVMEEDFSVPAGFFHEEDLTVFVFRNRYNLYFPE